MTEYVRSHSTDAAYAPSSLRNDNRLFKQKKRDLTGARQRHQGETEPTSRSPKVTKAELRANRGALHEKLGERRTVAPERFYEARTWFLPADFAA